MTFKPNNQVAAIAARDRKARAVLPRQKARYITAALIRKLDEVIEHKGKNGTTFEHILDTMISDALAGDSKLGAYLIERVEGKNPQEIAVSHTHEVDLGRLTEDQLLQLKAIVQQGQIEDAEYEVIEESTST